MAKILIFQSNPDEEEWLRIDREVREIKEAVGSYGGVNNQVIYVGAAKIHDLPRFLQLEKPDIFHFSGHGSSENELIFESSSGGGEAIADNTLKTIFEIAKNKLKCVVLNSCYSKPQAKIISQYIPYVIGNNGSIEDDGAIQFSKSLYSNLSLGLSIEESFKLAKEIAGTTDTTIFTNPKIKNLVVFKQPLLFAAFELNKNGNPKILSDEYNISFWVENYPNNVTSIVYNFNDVTMEEENYADYEEIDTTLQGATVERKLWGNLQVRIILWMGNNGGEGLTSTVHEALTRYYAANPTLVNDKIIEALSDIEDN